MTKEHVSKVCDKVNKRLGLLGRIRSCLTHAYTTVSCYQSCATPTRPGGELSVECKSRLQRLQNRAARILVSRDEIVPARLSSNLDGLTKKLSGKGINLS